MCCILELSVLELVLIVKLGSRFLSGLLSQDTEIKSHGDIQKGSELRAEAVQHNDHQLSELFQLFKTPTISFFTLYENLKCFNLWLKVLNFSFRMFNSKCRMDWLLISEMRNGWWMCCWWWSISQEDLWCWPLLPTCYWPLPLDAAGSDTFMDINIEILNTYKYPIIIIQDISKI